MERPNALLDHDGEPHPRRREILIGLAATCLASFIPPATAQVLVGQAPEPFLAVSQILTGRSSRDLGQAARLFAALAADAPSFEADIRALLAFIDEWKVDIGRLQQALDAEDSRLAALPRKIMTAWYTGIVGEGGAARCITFETSLMHVAVTDRLNPPSYCYGPHGSWSHKPGEEG